MYSRETGITTSQKYTSEYLQSKYAEKSLARRSPFKTEQKPAEPEPLQTAVTAFDNQNPGQKSVSQLLPAFEGDDILIMAVLAFLLFSGDREKNFDLILAAALLFIEFG